MESGGELPRDVAVPGALYAPVDFVEDEDIDLLKSRPLRFDSLLASALDVALIPCETFEIVCVRQR